MRGSTSRASGPATKTSRPVVVGGGPAAPAAGGAAGDLLALQRTIGNAAVTRLLGDAAAPALVQRSGGGQAAAEPRIVEGDEGAVTLAPLTLLDFMQDALVVMRGRDRARARQRAARAAEQERAERSKREVEAQRQRDAEEKSRLQAEEKQRLEALEKQRLAAEEKLRREEEDRKRVEAEERARREEEEKKRAEAEQEARVKAEEQKRLADLERQRQHQEAMEKLWADALAAIANELVQSLKTAVGADYWSWLDDDERDGAVKEVLATADKPYKEKLQLERAVNQKKKSGQKLSGEPLAQAVLQRVRDQGKGAVDTWAATLRKVGGQRSAADAKAQAEAAELAQPVGTTALTNLCQIQIPTNQALVDLYRAVAQNWIELVHNNTYRSEQEKKDKKNSTHGAFSREFSVRVYGTDPTKPNVYKWCSWIVHVHYTTSERPSQIEYLHLKKGSDKMKKINHVINPRLSASLGPLANSSVRWEADASLADIKRG